jgi:hypothetical protein
MFLPQALAFLRHPTSTDFSSKMVWKSAIFGNYVRSEVNNAQGSGGLVRDVSHWSQVGEWTLLNVSAIRNNIPIDPYESLMEKCVKISRCPPLKSRFRCSQL